MKRTKKRKTPLAKPATRRRAAKIVGRAGGYATAKKRKRKVTRKATKRKRSKQSFFSFL